MTTNTTFYAVLGVTGYYGHAETVVEVSEHDTIDEAKAAAAAYAPDYDAGVGCARLGHNQSSATYGVAVEYIKTVAVDDDADATSLCKSYRCDYVISDGCGCASLYRKV